MSEKSFAVASISVAVVWGTFFYPPAPQQANRAEAGVSALAAPAPAIETARLAPAPATPRPVLIPVAMNTAQPSTAARALRTVGLKSDCPFGSSAVGDGCAPMHKLAGE